MLSRNCFAGAQPQGAGIVRRHRLVCQAVSKPTSPGTWAHSSSKLTVWLAGTLTAGGLLLTTPFTATAADIALGEEVFNNNCAACHTGGNNVIQAEKTLRKAALTEYLDGGFSVEAITHQVENGKNAMPAWSGRLSEDEIQGVAAYVYKQASEDLW